MPIDDATWVQIRAAYCDSQDQESVAAIARRFNVTSKQLYARARAEAWPRRSAVPGSPAARMRDAMRSTRSATTAPTPPGVPTDAAPAPSPARRNSLQARKELALRLYEALCKKLAQLEKKMSEDTDTSSADHERETRAIAGVVRTFEKIAEIDPASPRPTADRAAAALSATHRAHPTDAAARAEQLRIDIAQRLERIMAGRLPPRDAS